MDASTQRPRTVPPLQRVARNISRRLSKLPIILLSAVVAFAFWIFDNLKSGLVSGASDWLSYTWSSPVYIVELSDAVAIPENGVTLRRSGELERLVRPQRVSLAGRAPGTSLVRFLEITVYPGNYFITLERSSSDDKIVLNEQPVFFGKPDGVVKINTAKSQWTSRAALTTLPQSAGAESGAAFGTRWTIAPSDAEALAEAEGRSAIILRAALGQLGVWEKGGEADHQAIDAYWDSARSAGGEVPSLRSEATWGLWGGAFLAWTVVQGGGSPPSNAAAFRSWQNWGAAVEPSLARPGMMVIVETGQRRAPTPSGLLVGIYLRQRADCVEVVTGNMADRVVVTCVRGKVLSFRSPG